MIEYKAFLSDFADSLGWECEVEEYLTGSQESNQEAESNQGFETDLVTHSEGFPLRMTIRSLTIDTSPYGLSSTHELEFVSTIGTADDPHALLEAFRENQIYNSSLVGSDTDGLVSLDTWKHDNGRNYVELKLRVPQIYIGSNHIERFGYYLARLKLLAIDVNILHFGKMEELPKAEGLTYYPYLHAAIDKADRVFRVGEDLYKESSLEAIDWGLPGIDSRNPETIPSEYVRSEFVNVCEWPNLGFQSNQSVRKLVLFEVWDKLVEIAQVYQDEQDVVWMLEHKLITVRDIVSGFNTRITFGSHGYYKVRPGQSPVNVDFTQFDPAELS